MAEASLVPLLYQPGQVYAGGGSSVMLTGHPGFLIADEEYEMKDAIWQVCNCFFLNVHFHFFISSCVQMVLSFTL